MTVPHPLSALVGRHRALALALERDFPEADAETLADTLEGVSGLRKLVAPEFTAYLRPSPSKLIVVDDSLIPAEFWVEQRPRLDRQQVLAALKLGRAIPGAVLANPEPTLSIRSL